MRGLHLFFLCWYLLNSYAFSGTAVGDEKLKNAILPFHEMGESLGLLANNNEMTEGAGGNGVTIFDANNDGRLDLYFAHSGQPTTKKTLRNGLLLNELNSALPGALYLNMGVDSQSKPIFKSVQALMENGNQHYIAEELLIENKYLPRNNLQEDAFSPGRIGVSAIPADFNNDGNIDLYLLNAHRGVPYKAQETAWRIYPSNQNIGRESKKNSVLYVLNHAFLDTDLLDGLSVVHKLSTHSEFEGRNVLLLNLGDQDKDGIPEWKDVTEQAGVGGHWSSVGGSVADIDRDGDLDLYVNNFLDPDFFGFALHQFSGNRNQLYINQFSETGKLTFKDEAKAMQVSGLHLEENISSNFYNVLEKNNIKNTSRQLFNDQVVGEQADHSWSSLLTDWNDDGWPDLIVANDLANQIRIYENLKGKVFKRLTRFDQAKWNGCWMGIMGGDFNQDLSDDLLITSCGNQAASLANTANQSKTAHKPGLGVLTILGYPKYSTLHHVLLSFDPQFGLVDNTLNTQIIHSNLIAPDITKKENLASIFVDQYEPLKMATSLTGIEFSWGAGVFDLENDGDLDLYLVGGLARGNDGFLGNNSTNPGRLLVNKGLLGELKFEDLTLEYRLLDMEHMEYETHPPRRAAPGTGWDKRDYIYITDKDAYSEVGMEAAKMSEVHDIFFMHEAAQGVMAGDLNNDGFADLVVRHLGGYNSLSPEATNLKVKSQGLLLSLPATQKLTSPPTLFEAGRTFMYINAGVSEQQSSRANWISIKLNDNTSLNRHSVGAKIILNNKIMRRFTIGGSAFSFYHGALLVGLGKEALNSIKITWPSGDLSPESYNFSVPMRNQEICIQRGRGLVDATVCAG